jgi:hypothetical protein
MIYQEVLMVDMLNGMAPRYEHDSKEKMYYYAGNNIVKKHTDIEEITVPLFEYYAQDWDQILIELLNKCNQNIIQCKEPNWNMWCKVDDVYAKEEIPFTSIITHTDVDFEVPPLTKVLITSFCPKDTMFVLPAPNYLGIAPTTDARQGMAVINSSLVVKIKKPKPKPVRRESLLDILVML